MGFSFDPLHTILNTEFVNPTLKRIYVMTFTLPTLPYAPDALGPYLSAESFDYHYGKHHKAYVDKANELLPASGLEGKSLESACLVASQNPAQGVLFNQLGQHYNHSLYWESMKVNGGGRSLPSVLATHIDSDLGGFEGFRASFVQAGMTQFGSGWAWLVMDNKTGKLEIVKSANADTPLIHGKTPLLVCDVWEHAYYIDYRNARQKFLEAFVDNLANWENAERLYTAGPLQIAA
jgi:Fe-Mn family superoxide dismutase